MSDEVRDPQNQSQAAERNISPQGRDQVFPVQETANRESINRWGTQSDSYKELSMLLGLAAPLWITRLLERGGPTTEDFKRVAGYNDELGRADMLLFGSKKQGEIASFFNKLAEAVGVLSFCPGGIELFDLRFESAPLLAEWQRREGQAKPQVGSAPPEGEVAAGDGPCST
jgi:hypothetical protein